jgi:putative ATPase
MYKPLADRMRPTSLDDVVGQEEILGKNGLLRRIIESGTATNMILFGPPGTGKTTIANIIADKTKRTLYKLNATTASISDIKSIISEVDTFMAPGGILLYLDEIQYFNKRQQQSLLEFIENGKIILIASTTENPYFYVYGAILSRSTVFEFKPVPPEEIEKVVIRAAREYEKNLKAEVSFEEGVVRQIALRSGGDVRKAINAVELLAGASKIEDGKLLITSEDAAVASQRSAMRFDRDGDSHYDLLSAFQKSIRGSDPDAAIYYLARLLEGGDLPSACRRLLVCAAEDVGLAYPQAMPIVVACVNAALQVGLPEAQIPLAEAVILCATAPKSNSAVEAISRATADIKSGVTGEVPAHLRDSSYKGANKLGRGIDYKYPHSYPNHFVPQQYLPDELVGKTYYSYGNNKTEQAYKAYWDRIKSTQTDRDE